MLRSWPRDMWRYPVAVMIIAASTGMAELLYRNLGTNRLSMIFLAGVLITAVTLGSGPAYLSATLAFFIYNFYLVEPRFSVEFASPEDVFVLMAFVAVAVLTGSLAGRVRDEARRAQARTRTMEALLNASREFSSSGDVQVIGNKLAQRIAEAVKGEAAVWDAGRIWSSPPGAATPDDVIASFTSGPADVAVRSEAFVVTDWRVRRLGIDLDRPGFAAWRPLDAERLGAEQEHLIDVLIDLGATALARARLAQAQAEVAALARTEQLRAALLSSISHDLRTPLAAILASATSLREFSNRFDEATRHDLALTIEEEAERLNRFVENLLSMTKLEGDGLSIQGVRFDVQETVDRAVRRLAPRLGARSIRVKCEGAPCTVLADPILVEQALNNVLENAARFTPEASEIEVHILRIGASVLVEIADQGPGVAAADLSRIFEKFYRSPLTSESLPGAGLGLSITKGLIEAMDGSVSARPGAGGRGLVVSLILPTVEMAA